MPKSWCVCVLRFEEEGVVRGGEAAAFGDRRGVHARGHEGGEGGRRPSMKEEAHQHLLLHQESSRQVSYRPVSNIRLHPRWVSLYLDKVESNHSIVESKWETRVLAGAQPLTASPYPLIYCWPMRYMRVRLR
jgi:hypothetical protein